MNRNEVFHLAAMDFYFLRWVVSVLIGVLFLGCGLCNWSVIIGLALRKVKHASMCLPFIGTALGILSFLLIPIADVAQFWWTALIIEPSLLLVGTAAIVTLIAKKMKRP